MKLKGNFTIGGPHHLQKAFAEVLGIPIFEGIDMSYPYLCGYASCKKEKFDQTFHRNNTHFHLPEDWDKAMEYCREYFKLDKNLKYKPGDWIKLYSIPNDGFGLAIRRIETIKPIKAMSSAGSIHKVDCSLYPIIDPPGIVARDSVLIGGIQRHANLEEIFDHLKWQAELRGINPETVKNIRKTADGVKITDTWAKELKKESSWIYEPAEDCLWCKGVPVYVNGVWAKIEKNRENHYPFGDSTFVVDKKSGTAYNREHAETVYRDDFERALEWLENPPTLAGYLLKIDDEYFWNELPKHDDAGKLAFGCQQFTIQELRDIVNAFK